jgi:hypothetical protein
MLVQPLVVEKLVARPVHPLELVRPEEVALRLKQVGWKSLLPVAVKIAERRTAKARQGIPSSAAFPTTALRNGCSSLTIWLKLLSTSRFGSSGVGL